MRSAPSASAAAVRFAAGRLRSIRGRGRPSGRAADLVDEPQQVERAERLGEEEVGARVLRTRARCRGAGRGEHHDRRPGRRGRPRGCARTPRSRRGAACRCRGRRSRAARAPAISTASAPSLASQQLEARDVLERRGDQLADERVVVDDQDRSRISRSPRGSARSTSSGMRGERVDDRGVELGARGPPRSARAPRRAARPAGTGRSVVSASSVSATAKTRAASGMSSPASPSG